MKEPRIFNIQKYSIHDGEGIRTTIFFKGCPLSCKWCHNPESQHGRKELMYFADRCIGCGACVKKCPVGANTLVNGKVVLDREKCTGCGICTDWCAVEARELVGKDYSIEQLVKEAEKDRMFYETSGGGITLSGGEVMCTEPDVLEKFCSILHGKGYSVNVDTSGYAPYENFSRILPYIDTFLYDIKHMDPEEHKKYMGVDNKLILENLKKLSEDGARINIRIPVIGNVNDTEEQMNQIIDFLQDEHIQVVQVNLLPYHNTGMGKYGKLDRPYDSDSMTVPSKERMELFSNIFKANGFHNTKIGG